MFGDGAGATIWGLSDTPGLLGVRCSADGAHAPLLTGTVKDGKAAVNMQGREIFKLAVKRLVKVVDEALAEHGLQDHELDWLVPHQANQRIIKAVAEHLRFDMVVSFNPANSSQYFTAIPGATYWA